MNRYIDADALITKLDEQIQMPTFLDCLSAINSAPSIDIVRCAECKYKQQCHKAVEHTTHDRTSVTIAYRPIEFCSYGERKESE